MRPVAEPPQRPNPKEIAMTRIRSLAALALAVAVAVPAGTALASSDGDRADRRHAEAAARTPPAMEAPAAIAAVYGAGYADITEMEWERGGWTVKAADGTGRRVGLRVDGATGAVAPRGR
jgi:hypothetical protein